MAQATRHTFRPDLRAARRFAAYGAIACGVGFTAGFGYLMAQELVWFITGLADICHG